MDPQHATVTVSRAPAGTRPSSHPAARRPDDAEMELACRIAQSVVAVALGEPSLQPLGGHARSRRTAFARQVAMYLAHVGFGRSMAEVARAFGRDRTTVVHACHLIEDRRDEARFDVLLDHLEQAAAKLHAAHRLNHQD